MSTAVSGFTAADEARHAAGPDPWWQESIAFHWCDLATGVGGMHRLGHEPHRDGGVIAHHSGVFAPGVRWRRNVTTPMSGERDARWFGDGEESFTVEDGHPHYRLDADGCTLDLVVDDLYALTDFFPRGSADLTDNFAAHHYETSGRVRGTIRLDGQTLAVAGSCHRDHSWGIRRWSDAIAAHRWVSGVLDDGRCFGSVSWLGPDGTLVRGGYLVEDGAVRIADDVDVVTWVEADGTSHRGGELTLWFGGQPLLFTCHALDGWLNEHHGVSWLDKLCSVEHAGVGGYCDFETSQNARLGTAPIKQCAGAAITNGLVRA